VTQRERMLDAVIDTVAEKGFAEMTVADVVARAGVSRRTFYEQFTDKLDCFLAAYEERAAELERVVAAAVAAAAPGERLRAGLQTYLEHLAANPTAARVLTIDIYGAGPAALEARECSRARFADQYRAVSDDADVLRALVGGIAELVQARLLAGAAESLPELVPTLERFVKGIARDRGEVAVR
jgi:AcrR family transcriptional regulator